MQRSEGGHSEWSAMSEEDMRLRKFAMSHLTHSNGDPITRLSVERLTAGPAIPLLYEFYKTEYPDLEVVCPTNEETKWAEGKDIFDNALKNKDPLCLKVLDKFLENLAVYASDI